MEGQLSAVAMLESDKCTQKHNNSTKSADMDTNSMNMTGKSSNTKTLSNLEDIEELEEEIWSDKSQIDTSVVLRSRMRTRDSAYESTEDLSNLEGKYMFRNESKDKKQKKENIEELKKSHLAQSLQNYVAAEAEAVVQTKIYEAARMEKVPLVVLRGDQDC